jgi:diguanylate cyclase (GGDEF)-like protein/PAS domain S-box-containing protein
MLLNFLSKLLKPNTIDEDKLFDYLKYDYDIKPAKEALRITLIYGIVGVLWIIGSDEVLSEVVKDVNTFKTLAMFKGWLYVLITMIIVYSLVFSKLTLFKRALEKIHDNYESMSSANEELVALQEDLKEQFIESEKHRNALITSEQRYELAVEGADCGIWDWDVEMDQWYFSPKCKKYLGFEDHELKNDIKDWIKLLHSDSREKALNRINDYVISGDTAYESTFRMRCKDDSYKWMLSKGKSIRNSNGKVIRVAGSFADITDFVEMNEKLNLMAYYDMLTELPNRFLLEANLENLIKEASENKKRFALVYMDVDNFKNINDTMGHLCGDKLLKDVSTILKERIKQPNIIARLGGDEFAIVFVDIEDKKQVASMVKDLIQYLRKPWVIEGQEFFISFSAGIALYPGHGETLSILMKNADMAMYYVKKNMKDDYCFYNSEMEELNLNQVKLVNDLRRAIDNEQFILYYQPIINLYDSQVNGVEALIRWYHPEKGIIPPIDFIPLAEEAGLIYDIEKWVLKTALIQKKQWEEKGYHNIKMSINISGKAVVNGGFIDYIKNLTQEITLNYGEVQFEVTETAFMEDLDLAINNLKQIKKSGIKIALDDFGTGYSSLTYLKKLPIDVVKLDRGFIKTTTNIEEEPIIHYVIKLINRLELKLVAEGVETIKQLNFLKKNNCDYAQGYLFSRPVESKEVEIYFTTVKQELF